MKEKNTQNDPHKNQPVVFKGAAFKEAKAAMILIHGRGASADSILTLTEEFTNPGFIYAAPQAAGFTWYPYSFLSPIHMNEPGISSGLNKIKSIINTINENGISTDKIFLLGFSQGACLALEYAAQNPQKFGGVIGLSGGLIGETENINKYTGTLNKTKVFLGCSDIDPHIPLNRVNFTEEVMKNLNGSVIKKIYKNMDHTVNQDELRILSEMMS